MPKFVYDKKCCQMVMERSGTMLWLVRYRKNGTAKTATKFFSKEQDAFAFYRGNSLANRPFPRRYNKNEAIRIMSMEKRNCI